MADSRCESVVLGLLPSAFERAEIAGALGPSGSPGREQREAELHEQVGARAATICRTARVSEERYQAGIEEATRSRWPRVRTPRAVVRALPLLCLAGVVSPGVWAAVGATRSGWAERMIGALLVCLLLLGMCVLGVKLVRWLFRRPARRAIFPALFTYNLLIPASVVAASVWDVTGRNVVWTLLAGVLTAVVGAGAVLIVVGDLDPLELATAADRAHVRELEKACFDREHSADDLSIVVPAPVQYDRREFMLHLYASACRGVVVYAGKRGGLDDVVRDAAARFEQVRFLQTYSREMSGQLGVRGSGVGAKRGVALVRQPLTYPEVVADLREFLTTAALALRGHGERSGTTARLLVGVDELDRIEPAERARDFIDEIKVIFEIPNCLYLVTAGRCSSLFRCGSTTSRRCPRPSAGSSPRSASTPRSRRDRPPSTPSRGSAGRPGRTTRWRACSWTSSASTGRRPGKRAFTRVRILVGE